MALHQALLPRMQPSTSHSSHANWLPSLCPEYSSISRTVRPAALPAAPTSQLLGRCRTLPPPRASLITSVAETATLAAAVGGITLSALPLLTGEARKRNAERPINEETSEEDFVFGVMSAVGFLPYVNWTVRCCRFL